VPAALADGEVCPADGTARREYLPRWSLSISGRIVPAVTRHLNVDGSSVAVGSWLPPSPVRNVPDCCWLEQRGSNGTGRGGRLPGARRKSVAQRVSAGWVVKDAEPRNGAKETASLCSFAPFRILPGFLQFPWLAMGCFPTLLRSFSKTTSSHLLKPSKGRAPWGL